jgi:hypothetical protein
MVFLPFHALYEINLPYFSNTLSFIRRFSSNGFHSAHSPNALIAILRIQPNNLNKLRMRREISLLSTRPGDFKVTVS